MENQRDKAIAAVGGEIEKQFGKGAVMRLGNGEAAAEVAVISTGSLGVDIALGTGGLPRGRIVEVYGPESSGKTTLALHVVGEAQKAGGVCAFVDAEHALDVGYARDRKSTRLNSSHMSISYAVFCLKKKKKE